MRLTFRLKVILFLIAALFALALMIIGSEIIAGNLRAELDHVEARLVPRAELALKLEASFVDLTRSFQDAVSAQDLDGLNGAKSARDTVLSHIKNAGQAVEPTDAAALRFAIDDYFSTAHRVSVMLINGETDERTVAAIAEMQDKQKAAEQIIGDATSMGRGEIAHSFASLRQASLKASHFRWGMGIVSLLFLVGILLWASRQLLRSVSDISVGINSFATGDFERPIAISSNDELGDLTRDVNAMAANLQRLASDRDRTDWLKSGQVELSHALRGNQSLQDTAERAVNCVVRRVGALAAALYLKDEEGLLRPLALYADPRELAPSPERTSELLAFAEGEGLLGQAGIEGGIRVVHDLPPGYFDVISGLGRSAPRTLVIFSLKSDGKTVAVVELALFDELSERARQFIQSVEDTLVVALQAARSREEADRLLTETRDQAERLAQQEEELRLSNQELSVQQEELRQANVDLELNQQTLTERNQALDRAREREQEKAVELNRVSLYKSQFLANMSHELRTPLNSMLLLSHLLSENSSGNLTEKQVEHCRTIHSAGEDLLELINQVLDLAKIEAGKQDVDISTVPLKPLVDQLRRLFEPLAANKSLSFNLEISPEVPDEIYTDRARLERILINLLGNAIKFTEKGHVTLSVGFPSKDTRIERADLVASSTIVFVVSDSGIGIAPSELARVFSPFEQVEATSARRYEGSGLGLTIARESASLLGGELQVESELGRGSKFTCYLPRGSESKVEMARGEILLPPRINSASPEDAPGLVPKDAPGLILVIEDDRRFAEQLVEVIEDRGFVAIVESSGARGLEVAHERRPCGIVLDVKLPDVDGWTVMERLRSSPITRDIPVHFLSAMDAAENGLSRGAIGYLQKPATREQLKELIETLAPTRRAEGSKILVVEDNVAEGQSIVALLEHEWIEATHVTSAEAALAALERDTYNCLVVDLGLEETDGLELLETLQKKPNFARTGVVIHTGRSLTRKETNRLQAYSQAIVMKDGSSSTRLLEEIRLFIHHVQESSPKAEAVAPHTTFEGTRVLIVEDDMRTVYSLSALLQSRGCEVLVAENGREALNLLKERHDVACVLMDIMMPEMDGYEAMRHLRSDEVFRTLPIIALTAKAMAGERERCIEAGANDYLSKPVDSDNLFAALERWIAPPEVQSAV